MFANEEVSSFVTTGIVVVVIVVVVVVIVAIVAFTTVVLVVAIVASRAPTISSMFDASSVFDALRFGGDAESAMLERQIFVVYN